MAGASKFEPSRIAKQVLLQGLLVLPIASAALARASSGWDAPPLGDVVFAVPRFDFYRSAAMQCSEFDVAVHPSEAHTLQQYIVDFRREPPSSGIALEGTFTQFAGGVVDFAVSRAVGPWQRILGITPKLKRLTLRVDDTLSDKFIICEIDSLFDRPTISQPMKWMAHMIGAVSGRTWPESPSVRIDIDTSKAFNWVRFRCFLDWARYMLRTMRSELRSMPRSASSVPTLVDLGGGSGFLSLLFKANLGSTCEVWCTDIASEAVELAAENAAANALDIKVAQGDMFEPLEGRQPNFVYFNPPQLVAREGEGGSPDVSVVSPGGDPNALVRRFCYEVDLAPDGISWLGVDWARLSQAVEICCAAGWTVKLPAPLRDITDSPSALLELKRAGSVDKDCAAKALAEAAKTAEFQVAAIGANDDEKRLSMLRNGAKRGLCGAQNNLGVAYAGGFGVPSNARSAEHWFREAARRGSEEAQFNLGKLLIMRNGEHHKLAGVEWISRAAEHGHPLAQTQLGIAYSVGLGVPQNDALAALWLERAAAQGDSEASEALYYLGLDMAAESDCIGCERREGRDDCGPQL